MTLISRRCPKCKELYKVELKSFVTKEAKIKSFHKAEQELAEKIYNCDCKNK